MSGRIKRFWWFGIRNGLWLGTWRRSGKVGEARKEGVGRYLEYGIEQG